MPTGSNLDINKVRMKNHVLVTISNQGYLNKIKKQLERREEKASMRQLSTSLPLPAKIGLSVACSAKPPVAELKPVGSPSGSTTNKQNTNKQSTEHEIQRLKGLGLTVSVGQVSKPIVAADEDKGKTQSKVDSSFGQKPRVLGVSAQKPSGREKVGSSEKSPQPSAAAGVKSTPAPASAFSAAQKLQLKSQV